jgi:hypothetical protein
MNLEALNEIPAIWDKLSASEKRLILAELDAIEDELTEWQPIPGPQTLALETNADIILYGGAAGGGKSFLALGKALLQHKRVLILREEFPQLAGLIESSKTVYDRYGKFRETPVPLWRLRFKGVDKLIEFGQCKLDKDKNKYQGRAHDLRVIDEAANFLESVVVFLAGWVRSEDPHQKCQLLLLSNPPTSQDGRWLFEWFRPWLDKKHPNPASPGELRWFARINNKDTEVKNNKPFVLEKNKIIYDFNPDEYSLEKIIIPKSRTFIPARVTDNPYYVASGYIATLQAMPEPLRSQMLYGDFLAGQEDDAWQVIPTEWVKAAQARWEATPKPQTLMTALGVDVARGGRDKTILSPLYGVYYDHQIERAGLSTPDGYVVADQVCAIISPYTDVNIDVIGVGSSPYDILKARGVTINGIQSAAGSDAFTRNGLMGFVNKRAEMWWGMREALDPINGDNICLPPSEKLLEDLTTPLWRPVRGKDFTKIQIESKEDIFDRIGRSPDHGDSVVYARAEKQSGISFAVLR